MNQTQLLLGLVMPVVLSIANRYGWPPDIKRGVALLACAVVAGIELLLSGQELSLTAFGQSVLTVYGASQLLYAVAEPTGILSELERRTG